MSDLSLGYLMIGVLLVLIALGVPIAFSLMTVGIIGYSLVASWGGTLALVSIFPFTHVASYVLTVLPLFVIMGSFASYAGLNNSVFDTAYKWLGRLRGGLAMASVGACAGFAAMCGSSVATAASIGKIAIPQMQRYGYDDSLAAGCISSAGTLGILIPPSGMMVVYSFIADVSLGKLLVAGILPGILTAVMDMLLIYVLVTLKPKLAPLSPTIFSWKEKLVSLKGAYGIIVVAAVLIGGIYSGFMTATEAGAAGAFVTFVIFMTSRGRSRRNLFEALLDAGQTSCMIALIIVGAFFFAAFLTYVNLPSSIAEMFTASNLPPLAVAACILAVYIFLGTFMEGIAMVLITVPIFLPTIMHLGFNPVWFGILVVKMVEVGQITPPVAVNIYVIKSIAPDIPLTTVIKGVGYFFGVEVVTTALLLLFPQISLFLPTHMLGK